MYYVYILKSNKDGGFYIGCSNNPSKRLLEHNSGKTQSLKNRRPLRIVYTEKYDNVKEAYNREKTNKVL